MPPSPLKGPLSDLPSEGLGRGWPLSCGAGAQALGSALGSASADPPPALRRTRQWLQLTMFA